jgi:hypothetical protein
MFALGSNSVKGVLDRPCSADWQLPELVGRVFAMDTISQFGQNQTLLTNESVEFSAHCTLRDNEIAVGHIPGECIRPQHFFRQQFFRQQSDDPGGRYDGLL